MRTVLSDVSKIEIFQKYQTGDYTYESLAREYGISRGGIKGILNRRGLKCNKTRSELSRKYPLDEHYFDTIDTETKAYFLGLLYADGCNLVEANSIVLPLQERDKHILDKFATELQSNRPLHFVNRKSKNPNWQNIYRFAISSHHMCKRLVELGCVPRKSLVLEFPTEEQVPSHLLHHFVRGYFDGDGYFGVYVKREKYKDYGLKIISTKSFCESLKEILVDSIQIEPMMFLKHPETGNLITTSLEITGRMRIYKFLDWIYKDATVYLQRKYDKYSEEQIDDRIIIFSEDDTIIINGVENTVKEWCDIYKIGMKNVRNRVTLGWSREEAITIPVRKIKQRHNP